MSRDGPPRPARAAARRHQSCVSGSETCRPSHSLGAAAAEQPLKEEVDAKEPDQRAHPLVPA
eukprot:CAMPEP_0206175618 /NCGR_PEP_ID=MMETSP1474-20131121/55466_1 /ASSEMBLY_ACC=CAM_ASM_001110 /TAXON_ID=97495 /ORGANISM="Imantonia sp., Strain RCC918" /LENGTH=61 /DNA_ID=CAMNT_0053585963 /DNA_START=378 /DNA_END=559 /DNA_ORIENTATION=-